MNNNCNIIFSDPTGRFDCRASDVNSLNSAENGSHV